jgi:hypothetical protein
MRNGAYIFGLSKYQVLTATVLLGLSSICIRSFAK